MIAALLDGVPRRGLALLAVALALLLAAPFIANDYLLTVLILFLYFAYAGQAWNIMFGFAGQLSLGHAIFVGLGGYASAAVAKMVSLAFIVMCPQLTFSMSDSFQRCTRNSRSVERSKGRVAVSPSRRNNNA